MKTISIPKHNKQLLKELFHPNKFRKTGRTSLLAEVFGELAIENIGVTIYPIDHFPLDGNVYIMNRIKKWLHEYSIKNNILINYTFTSKSFKIKSIKNK
jgi:hypothetical protein